MIQLLVPAILEFIFFIIIIWVVYSIIMTYVKLENPSKNPIKKICWIVTFLASLLFVFYVINISSVNEVPRTEIDRSAQQEGKQNFEDRLAKDTITNKK